MTRPRHRWQPHELEFLRQHYATMLTAVIAATLGIPAPRVLAKANEMRLHKSRQLIAETARLRTLDPNHGSHRTRRQPGEAPWNKGVAGVTGTQPGCRVTQFKPGSKPHTWVPVGSYRVCEGQLQRKFSDAPGNPEKRWRAVTRLVWEAAHGDVPAGHVVVFKPGRQTTDLAGITLDAIELVTRAENMRRNSHHTNYPPELRSLVQLRGALTRQINRKAKETAET